MPPRLARLRAMTKTGLMLALMICFCSCAHVKVIPADKALRRVKSGAPFIAPVDGWFVPDARWLEINEALAGKLADTTSATR